MSLLHQLRRITAFFCLTLAATAEIKVIVGSANSARTATVYLTLLLIPTIISSLILWNPAFGFQPDIQPTRFVRRSVWSVAAVILLALAVSFVVCMQNKPVTEDRMGSLGLQLAALLGWYNGNAFFFGARVMPDRLRLFFQGARYLSIFKFLWRGDSREVRKKQRQKK